MPPKTTINVRRSSEALLCFVSSVSFHRRGQGRQKTDGRKSDFCTVPSSVFRPLLSDSTSTFGRVKSNYLEELFRDPKTIDRQTKLLLVIQNIVLAQFMTPDL